MRRMVWFCGGGHRGAAGAVGKVRRTTTSFLQQAHPRRRGVPAHERLSANERAGAFS